MWRWGRGRLYIYRYTVTTRMTHVLRWAAMKANLMFQSLRGTKSQDSVHRPQLLKRKESRSGFELRSLCLTARPNRLTARVCQVVFSSVDDRRLHPTGPPQQGEPPAGPHRHGERQGPRQARDQRRLQPGPRVRGGRGLHLPGGRGGAP